MPINRTYLCPDCGGKFKFLHMTRDEPAPDNCEICGNFMGEEPVEALAAPAYVGSDLSRSVDKVYRDLAVQAGVTNLNDRLKPGEVAGRFARNAVTETAESMDHSYWQGSNTAGYVADAKRGGNANITGAGALRAIQGIRK